MVVVVIPRWLLRGWAASDTKWAELTAEFAGSVLGGLIFLFGFALFVWCISLFARIGKGTLAPWDPTKRLVVAGPYRHVRNPMISGVAMMLVGEALFHGSRVLAFWTLIFIAFNYLYFIEFEEPGLERRFGEDYVLYKASVPRWIPRLTPWSL